MTVEYLSLATFKEKVFDFEANQEWNFKGDKPAVIDFYADWCGPCKTLGPIVEELSNEYEGDVTFYKVDTGAEEELAGMFGIRSIPSLLFIPTGDKPQMSQGALPKETFKKVISEVLSVESK
ncbi:MAG: thioredoxin [bacterium]|nr:thioredoxin [bacterium]